MGLTAVLKKKTKFFTIDVELSCPDGRDPGPDRAFRLGEDDDHPDARRPRNA